VHRDVVVLDEEEARVQRAHPFHGPPLLGGDVPGGHARILSWPDMPYTGVPAADPAAQSGGAASPSRAGWPPG
jgi:hypothetical protein